MVAIAWSEPKPEIDRLHWVTKDGRRLRIDTMSHSHLIHTTIMIHRNVIAKAKKMFGATWTVEETHEALLTLHEAYPAMVFELKRRGLDPLKLQRPPKTALETFGRPWTKNMVREIKSYQPPKLDRWLFLDDAWEPDEWVWGR